MESTKNYATLDWGGSNARAGVVEVTSYQHGTRDMDPEVKLIEGTHVSFPTEGVDSIEEILNRSIGEVINRVRKNIDGIAICVASPVGKHRYVINACNTELLAKLPDYDLRSKAEDIFELPAVVSNDCQATTAGESIAGALKGKKYGMVPNIGTGWGGGYKYNGEILDAEPGHIYLPGSKDVECGCQESSGVNRMNCAEARYCGRAIKARFLEHCEEDGIEIPDGMHPLAFADQRAKDGEVWEVELYREAAKAIGEIWGSDINRCNKISDIVYQGTFIECAMSIGFFRKLLIDTLNKRNAFKHEVKIQPLQAPRLPSGESLGPLFGNAMLFKQVQESGE